MDKNLAVRLMANIDKDFKQSDLMRYVSREINKFSNLSNFKNNVLQNINKMAPDQKYLLKPNIYKVLISGLQDNFTDELIIAYILKTLISLESIMIWNSCITERVIEMLSRYFGSKPFNLSFNFCGMGSKTSKFLRKFNLENLNYLEINSESISNKQLTSVFKGKLSSLKLLVLQNTSLTSDIGRAILKAPLLLCRFSFLGHQKARTLQIFKIAVKIVDEDTVLHQFSPYYESYDYLYYPQVVKTKGIIDISTGQRRQLYKKYAVFNQMIAQNAMEVIKKAKYNLFK